MVYLPRLLKLLKYPVPVCPEVAHSTGRLRENFMYQNFWSQVVVLQKGVEPLSHYDLCGIHMPSKRLIKHWRIRKCDNNTQMWWRTQDMAIANWCTEVNFSLKGEEGAENIELVDVFNYLGQPLDRSCDNCSEVLSNIRKAQQVWGWLGKLLKS